MSDEWRAQIERLPDQIREFYDAYFSELRRQLEGPDVFVEAVPEHMKGYKRIVVVGGSNGLIVVHFPIEMDISIDLEDGTNLLYLPAEPDANDDRYEFTVIPNSPVSEIAKAVSGGEEIDLGVVPGVPWGVMGFSSPQQKVDPSTGSLAWQAPWTRLVAADSSSLSYFEDPERARAEAREDIEPYIQQ